MSGERYVQKASGGIIASEVDWRKQQGQALPPDLLEEAAGRTGTLCLIYAVTYFLAYFGAGLADWARRDPVHLFFLDGRSYVAWGAIGLALGLFFLVRRSNLKPETILDLGLVFLVVGAAGISSINFWGIFPEGVSAYIVNRGFFGIPWEAVWIVIFPVIVPNCPKKTLLFALLAATTGPLTTTLSQAAGATSPELSPWFFWRYFLFTSYLCAFLAWSTASYIHKLGSNLTQARKVGSYTMAEKLGEGGMGEVWRAEHLMLARPAAIKLIRPGLLGSDAAAREEAKARFKREAQATAMLQSPHTIKLFDFGSTADGSFYYVMELLEGISLDRLVQKYGPQPPERVAFLLQQICHSLHDAHTQGVVHRDIKPSNLFLCRLGQDHDFVKVLDFGLVKATGSRAEIEASLTQVGVTAGTPAYLSPEMALGRDDLGPASDLYSLGCVAVWLLTGEPLFRGEGPLDTVAMHLKDEPVPPSRSSEFEIPADFERVIMSCLAKEPADRPADAQEMADRLAACGVAKKWDRTAARNWWEIHEPVEAQRAELAPRGSA